MVSMSLQKKAGRGGELNPCSAFLSGILFLLAKKGNPLAVVVLTACMNRDDFSFRV